MRLCHCRAGFRRQVGRGVGEVHLQALDQGSEGRDRCAFAALGHLGQHVGRKLQVPRIVELAGFHHRAARSGCVAATLEGQRGEGGLAGFAEILVGDHLDHVIGTEVRDDERTGANGVEVRFGAFRCLGAEAIRELGRLDDGRLATHEGAVWVWLWLCERHLDGQVVNNFDAGHAVELGALRTAAFGVHAVISREFHVC